MSSDCLCKQLTLKRIYSVIIPRIMQLLLSQFVIEQFAFLLYVIVSSSSVSKSGQKPICPAQLTPNSLISVHYPRGLCSLRLQCAAQTRSMALNDNVILYNDHILHLLCSCVFVSAVHRSIAPLRAPPSSPLDLMNQTGAICWKPVSPFSSLLLRKVGCPSLQAVSQLEKWLF